MHNPCRNLRRNLKRPVLTHPQDIERSNNIPWSIISARCAHIYTSTSLPTPTNGTRLRAISFINLNSASSLVVQLLNDLGIAGTADLLRPDATNFLRRLIKRLADID